MIDVSVVMGVHNGAEHLAETMDSVLDQRNVDFEFVIVDDGSTDESPAILRQYAERDSRVRVITQANGGLTRALIHGCSVARGKYIARHDVGDFSVRDRLVTQKAVLDGDERLVFVSSWTRFVGPAMEFIRITKGTGLAGEPRQILADGGEWGTIDGPTSHGSVMFRRDAYEAVGGYRPEFYYGQDWDLWYRLASIGLFQIIEKPLFIVRLLPTGLSAANRDRQRQLRELSLASLRLRQSGLSDDDPLRQAASIRPHPARATEVTMRQRGQWLYFIGEQLRRNRDARARRYFIQAIAACPYHLQSWLRLGQSMILTYPKRADNAWASEVG
jgi:glycosyltransferase involved in cell wall biosynthesis